MTILLLLLFSSINLQAGEAQSARGAELLMPFKIELKQALVAGMQQGPINAISVCKDEAPAIAESVATDDIRMGRTSHRLRNPANSAPGWVDEVLTRYLDDAEDHAPRVVNLANGREGYVEPILMQALCLACHGKDITPDVAVYIETTYPEDQATGFEIGDLRGVFWVEYPKQ